MPQYLSNEQAGTTSGLTQQTAVATGYKPAASVVGGVVHRVRATIQLAGQLNTDTLFLGNIPNGATFAYGLLTASVSLGASTLAIGVAGSLAKYRAAGVLTVIDTPTLFGNTAQVALASPLSADEPVVASIGAASLPASGTLVVDLFYTFPN